MKTKLDRLTLHFRTARCLAAASERGDGECVRGLRASGTFMWKLRAAIALTTALTLPVMAADPPVSQAPPPAASEAPPATPVPPPSAPAKLGAAELEKLLMPIALYPDALIATMLPAAVYPLEIVQAARFLQDTNNASKIDQQSWDESVKAVAKVPAALKKMNDDLPWTIQLGEVFLNQDKDVMDTIQSLRSKAQKAGTLKTTEQQIVIVTNTVVEKTVEQRVVVVTNTVVQIVPSNPQVVYVPTYPPTVYYPPPGPPPIWTFAAGVAVGAIIANNCDWHGGGVYYGGGGHHGDVYVNNSVNIDNSRGGNTINNSGNKATQYKGGQGGQKWQPDQTRVKSSGSPASAKTMESRGWGSGSANAAARPSTQPAAGNRGGGAAASTPSAGTRPSNPSAGAKPSTPSASARPTTPSASTKPAASPSTRPSGGSPSAGKTGAGAQPSASTRSSGSSAFSGGGGGDRQSSARGASSRGGGGGGGGRGGGGGSKGGGGGRR